MKQLLRRHGGNRGQSTKPQGAQKPTGGCPAGPRGFISWGSGAAAPCPRAGGAVCSLGSHLGMKTVGVGGWAFISHGK